MENKINIELIKEIVEVANKNSLEEFSLEVKDFKIHFKKGAPILLKKEEDSRQLKIEKMETFQEEKVVSNENKNLHEIKSPLVGVFYRAPNPDSTPYIEEEDEIIKGQTLCIIEAMKIMNEITSDIEGKIVKILPKNGQVVEFNQVLFLVETI